MPLSDVKNGTIIPFSLKRLTPKGNNMSRATTKFVVGEDVAEKSCESASSTKKYSSKMKLKSSATRVCSLKDITNVSTSLGAISLRAGHGNKVHRSSNNRGGKNFMKRKDNNDLGKQNKINRKRRCSLGIVGGNQQSSKLKFIKKEAQPRQPGLIERPEKQLSSGSVRRYKDHRSNNKLASLIPLKEQEIETAKQYIIQAKQFAKQKDPSNINLAIMMYQKAKKILPNNEKLTIRIAALENRLAMLQPEAEDDEEIEETKYEKENCDKVEPLETSSPTKDESLHYNNTINQDIGKSNKTNVEVTETRENSSPSNLDENTTDQEDVNPEHQSNSLGNQENFKNSFNENGVDNEVYQDSNLSAKEYILKAKHHVKMKDVNNLESALKYFKLAQEKLPLKSDKLSLKIASLENRILILRHTNALDEDEDSDEEPIRCNSNMKFPPATFHENATTPTVITSTRVSGSPMKPFSSVEDPLIAALQTKTIIEDPLIMALNFKEKDVEKNINKQYNEVEVLETKQAGIDTNHAISPALVEVHKHTANDDSNGSVVSPEKPTVENKDDHIKESAMMHLNVTPIVRIVKRLKMKFKSKAANVILDTLPHCQLHKKLVSVDGKTTFQKLLKHLDTSQLVVQKSDDSKDKPSRKVRFCSYDLSTITTPIPPPCFEEKRQTASKLASGMQALCRSLASLCITARRIRIESKGDEELMSALKQLVDLLGKPSHLSTFGEKRIAKFYSKKLQNFTAPIETTAAWVSPFAEKLSDSLSSILRHHLRCALNKPQGPIRVTNERLISDMREQFVQMIPGSGSLEFNYDDVAAVTHDALRMYLKGIQFVQNSPQIADILEIVIHGENSNKGKSQLHTLWDLVEAHHFLKSLLGHKFIRDAYMCGVVNKAIEGSWEALQKFGELASRFPHECPEEQIFVEFCTSPDKFLSDLIDMDETIDDLTSQLKLADAVLVSTEYSSNLQKIHGNMSIVNNHFKLPKIVTDMFQDNEEFAKNYLKNSRMRSVDEDEEIVDKLGRVLCKLCNRRTITHIDCSNCGATFHPGCLPIPSSTVINEDFAFFCTDCYSTCCLKDYHDQKNTFQVSLNDECHFELKDNRYF